MDVSALNLATMATGTEEATPGAPATTAIDGASFAKLLSGIGAAAVPPGADAAPSIDRLAAADQPAEGAPPPADPALLLQALRLTPAAVRPKGEGRAAAPDAREEPAPAAETAAPTTESLGLPPLLAALVAPTLAQAAPVAVAPAEGAPPAPAGTAPAATPVAAALPAMTAPATAAAPLAIPSTPAAAPAAPAGQPADRPAPAVPAADAALVVAPAAAAPAIASPATTARVAAAGSTPLEIAADATRMAPVAAGGALSPAAGAPTPRRAPAADAAPDIAAASDRAVTPDAAAEPAPPLATRAALLMPTPVVAAESAAPAAPVAVAAAGDAAPAAQPLIEHQLDMAREGEWLDQLTRDIVRTASSEGSLRFRLNPEHLGSLEVEVTQGQAGASVRLTADTEQARGLLADARPQLIAEARAQGVRIAEAHVDLGGRPDGQGGQSAAQSQAGNGGRGGRDLPAQEYLTSWQPESVEEETSRSRRSSAERYA